MKELAKKLGIVFIVIGVVVLGYTEFTRMENNTLLIVSGILIFGGLVVYVMINNYLD